MTIEELVEKDKTFDSATFITKANNIIKKIYNSITLKELDTVKHFMTEEIYNSFNRELEEAAKSNRRLIYEEVNVASNISYITETDYEYLITVETTLKYLKYYLSPTGDCVAGDMNNRITATYNYVFSKKKDALSTNNYKCPGCGSNINVNDKGKCNYCGTTFNLEDYDYILVDIK